jgi:hypothetical protein
MRGLHNPLIGQGTRSLIWSYPVQSDEIILFPIVLILLYGIRRLLVKVDDSHQSLPSCMEQTQEADELGIISLTHTPVLTTSVL